MYVVIFKWTKIVKEEFRISENSFMDKMKTVTQNQMV